MSIFVNWFDNLNNFICYNIEKWGRSAHTSHISFDPLSCYRSQIDMDVSLVFSDQEPDEWLIIKVLNSVKVYIYIYTWIHLSNKITIFTHKSESYLIFLCVRVYVYVCFFRYVRMLYTTVYFCDGWSLVPVPPHTQTWLVQPTSFTAVSITLSLSLFYMFH